MVFSTFLEIAAQVLDSGHFSVLVLPWMGPTGNDSMKRIGRILAGGAMVAVVAVTALPVLAQRAPSPSPTPVTRPAPGPIAGASLPVLVVGFGVYWLVKRRGRKAE